LFPRRLGAMPTCLAYLATNQLLQLLHSTVGSSEETRETRRAWDELDRFEVKLRLPPAPFYAEDGRDTSEADRSTRCCPQPGVGRRGNLDHLGLSEQADARGCAALHGRRVVLS
jgi:hypothetical protein